MRARIAVPLVLFLACAVTAAACGNPADREDASTTPDASVTAAALASTTQARAAATPPGTPSAIANTPTPRAPEPIKTPTPVVTSAPPTSMSNAYSPSPHASSSPTPWPTPTPRPTPAPAAITSETLTFDALPGPDWSLSRSNPLRYYPVSVNGGVLTIDSPNGGDTFGKGFFWTSQPTENPPDIWTRYADNSRGWWIEARFRVDPLTPDACESIYDPSGVGFRGGDWEREFRLLAGTTRMCLQTLNYPDTRGVIVPIDSTSAYHTYRLEVKHNVARVYVDGALKIDFTVPPEIFHGSDPAVYFGNHDKVERMVSYWDYFKYDVRGLGQ